MISVVDRADRNRTLIPEGQEFAIPSNAEEIARTQPVPPSDFLRRNVSIASNMAENAHSRRYWYAGFRDLFIYDAYARQAAGKSLFSRATILDWGCGAGRLTHHLARLPDAEVWGADIDAKNIEWASTHIRNCRFTTVPLSPPTELPDSHFDFVIGTSVFTHLDRQQQLSWLSEICRILKPDGIALVTVAGLHSFTVSRLRSINEAVPELLAHGIVELGGDRLGSTGIDSSYYKNTKQLPDFTGKWWGSRANILKIVPGGYRGLQDMVVLKRLGPA